MTVEDTLRLISETEYIVQGARTEVETFANSMEWFGYFTNIYKANELRKRLDPALKNIKEVKRQFLNETLDMFLDDASKLIENFDIRCTRDPIDMRLKKAIDNLELAYAIINKMWERKIIQENFGGML